LFGNTALEEAKLLIYWVSSGWD